jgi:hypothetical protein
MKLSPIQATISGRSNFTIRDFRMSASYSARKTSQAWQIRSEICYKSQMRCFLPRKSQILILKNGYLLWLSIFEGILLIGKIHEHYNELQNIILVLHIDMWCNTEIGNTKYNLLLFLD